MEKVGDMLEAAAETAVPATPANPIAVGDGHRLEDSRGDWVDWDAAPLLEFMNEEVIVPPQG